MSVTLCDNNGNGYNIPDGCTIRLTSGEASIENFPSAISYQSYSPNTVYGSGVITSGVHTHAKKEETMNITHVRVEGIPFNLQISAAATVDAALSRAAESMRTTFGPTYTLTATGNVETGEHANTLPAQIVRYTDALGNVHIPDGKGAYSIVS